MNCLFPGKALGLCLCILLLLSACEKPFHPPVADKTEDKARISEAEEAVQTVPPAEELTGTPGKTEEHSPSEEIATDPQSVVPPTALQPQEIPQDAVFLVKDGEAKSVILLDSLAGERVHDAVRRFVETVKRSTGAEIPIVSLENESEISSETTRIYVGDSPYAAQEGFSSDDLPPETYRIRVKDNTILILGAPAGKELRSSKGVASRPTLWALNRILEERLGVRWLWPGPLGTYVPKHRDLAVLPGDISEQPKLELRQLRINSSETRRLAVPAPVLDATIKQEAIEWCENHQNGTRSQITFGHNFSHWWKLYSQDHPDFFAELPALHKQPFPKPGTVKLRLANPAVIEQIAKEYEAAGAPKYWNVSPNDGSGFDISKETRAWDYPRNQLPQDIFAARANLTARYVKFWNLLYERLKQINPDVVLVTYAYSSYRNPPPKGHPLTARAIIQFVDGMTSFESWKGWAQYVEGIFLRPNWWHQGADAPYLSFEPTHKFIDFAWKHQMMGLDMDSILGYWATQGPNYYMVARQMNNPNITVEAVLNEYTSAFGKGASKIREYLDYWAKLTSKYNYSVNATGPNRARSSEYQKLVDAKKIPQSILNGSKYALPYLYTDKVLAPAIRLLDEAEALIGDSDEEALQRVAFLRKGLDSMKATRDLIERGQELKKNPSKKRMQEFAQASRELEEFREELAPSHVIWPSSARIYEDRYKILIRPSALKNNEINLDGF